MPSVAVTLLEVNGVNVENFNQVDITEVTYAKRVDLMNITDHAVMTQRHGLAVTYVQPQGGFPTEVKVIRNGTITLQYDDGTRVTFSGVYSLNSDTGSINGTDEFTFVVNYSAVDRIDE